jgi:hypothetical protein
MSRAEMSHVIGRGISAGVMGETAQPRLSGRPVSVVGFSMFASKLESLQ